MRIERFDGSKEDRTYASLDALMEDVKKVVREPGVKRILIFPSMRIPSKRKRKRPA